MFAVLIALCSIGIPSSQQSNEIGARLNQIIPKLMKEGEVPGLSIVVIQNARAVVFAGSSELKVEFDCIPRRSNVPKAPMAGHCSIELRITSNYGSTVKLHAYNKQ
jgi:hypothetical protein